MRRTKEKQDDPARKRLYENAKNNKAAHFAKVPRPDKIGSLQDASYEKDLQSLNVKLKKTLLNNNKHDLTITSELWMIHAIQNSNIPFITNNNVAVFYSAKYSKRIENELNRAYQRVEQAVKAQAGKVDILEIKFWKNP